MARTRDKAPEGEVTERVELDEEVKQELTIEERARQHHEAAPILQELVPLEEKTGRVFALMIKDVVHEIVEERVKIEDEWHPEFIERMRDITDLDPRPEVGWLLKGNKLEAPEPVEQTPQEKRNSALAGGAKVKVGSGKPATFSLRRDNFQRLSEVAQHVSMFGEFPGAAKTYTWPSEPPTEFKDTKTFLEAFRQLSAWREGWNQHAEGRGSAPADTIEV